LSTLPQFPPQKNIFPSSLFTQDENPDLAFGSLNGKVLNLLVFRLYSSISAVLEPSAYFPPNIRILDFDIGTAENFVLAFPI